MSTKFAIFTPTSVKLNKEPYILLPLKIWEEFEDLYEDYLFADSPKLQKELKEAEEEIKRGKCISLGELRKEIKIESKGKTLLNIGYEKPAEGKTNCLDGEVIKLEYEYFGGDCRFVLTYRDKKRIEITANDLGFDIIELNKRREG